MAEDSWGAVFSGRAFDGIRDAAAVRADLLVGAARVIEAAGGGAAVGGIVERVDADAVAAHLALDGADHVDADAFAAQANLFALEAGLAADAGVIRAAPVGIRKRIDAVAVADDLAGAAFVFRIAVVADAEHFAVLVQTFRALAGDAHLLPLTCHIVLTVCIGTAEAFVGLRIDAFVAADNLTLVTAQALVAMLAGVILATGEQRKRRCRQKHDFFGFHATSPLSVT